MNHLALKIGTLLGVVTALGYWKRERKPVGRHIAHVYREIDAVGRNSAYEDWDTATASIPRTGAG